MADSKVTALTELATTPDTADMLMIVDDPAGTPVSKKISVANLLAAGGGSYLDAWETTTGTDRYNIATMNLFASQTGFTTGASVGSVVSFYLPYTILDAGSLTGRYAVMETSNQLNTAIVGIDWDNEFHLAWTMALVRIDSQDIAMGAGGGLVDSASGVLSTNATSITRHAAFLIEDATIYASIADGGTQEKTDVSAGITLTDYNEYRVHYVGGTEVKFYINGTLVATLSTNIPTANIDFRWAWGVETSADGFDHRMHLSNDVLVLTKV